MSYKGSHLLSKVESIKGQTDYVAAYLHLSKLQRVNRQPHYIRIATTTFDPITLKNSTAAVFTLKNHDIIFIGQKIDRKELHDTIYKVRYLFSEDPLAKDEKAFFTLFNLDASYGKFYELVKKIAEIEGVQETEKVSTEAQPSTLKQTISPKVLASLEASIYKTDVTTLMKSKPVCTVIKDTPPQVIFYEKKILVKDYVEMVAPNLDIQANRWILQYLKELINERAIYTLSHNEGAAEQGTFSINLTSDTVLSNTFQTFDKSLGPDYARENVVVELSFLDVVYNYEDFCLARDMLRERGYRSCVTGLQPGMLTIFEPKHLSVDFIKISWDLKSVKKRVNGFVKALQDCMKHFGALNVILADCHSEEAMQFGQKLGLYLFQGTYIDRLISTVVRPMSGKK